VNDNNKTSPVTPEVLENAILDHRSWHNWILLASVSVITTLGLVVSVFLILNENMKTLSWMNTNMVLLGGLAVVVIVFVAYLTRHQMNVSHMNKDLQQLQDKSNRRMHRHTARLYALLNVSHIMVLGSDPQEVFDGITRSCVEAFECDQASLMLFDEEKKELIVRAADGNQDVSRILGRKQKLGEGIAGWAAAQKRSIILNGCENAEKFPQLTLKSPDISAAIVAPVMLRGELVGVLNVSSRTKNVRFDDTDLRALEVFAENIGTCIRYTEQADWMRRMIWNMRNIPATN
jgi:putative methionine-R-sulfoxide reductase with GAF domain